MFLKTLLVCYFQILFFVYNCNSVKGIKLIFSTNVTTTKVGHPFTVKCQVTNFDLNNKYIDIFFTLKSFGTIAYYHQPGTTTFY